jgi:hypothetical protein
MSRPARWLKHYGVFFEKFVCYLEGSLDILLDQKNPQASCMNL